MYTGSYNENAYSFIQLYISSRYKYGWIRNHGNVLKIYVSSIHCTKSGHIERYVQRSFCVGRVNGSSHYTQHILLQNNFIIFSNSGYIKLCRHLLTIHRTACWEMGLLNRVAVYYTYNSIHFGITWCIYLQNDVLLLQFIWEYLSRQYIEKTICEIFLVLKISETLWATLTYNIKL